MITKYSNYIKENKTVYSYFLQTYEETKDWLDSMNIRKYTINDDLTVDVDGDVNISHEKLTKIPVQFNKVDNFYCFSNKLTSLKGAPIIVNDCFYCHKNQLTSLKYVPKIVDDFNCSDNNLTSLEYSPTTVNYFYCGDNNLTSLEGAPTKVNDFICDNNQLTSLKYSPTTVNNFYCRFNPLEDINDLDSKILINSIKNDRLWIKQISTELYDDYFDHWIDKDINIFDVLKDKVSDNIKEKYKHLFNANKFDLL